MRFAVIAFALIIAGPAAASSALPGAVPPAAATGGFVRFAMSLPDPATAGLMCAGLGLVAGAQRGRSKALAD